jgi:uncharacterized protein
MIRRQRGGCVVGLINRERESQRLQDLWDSPAPTLALIYGRRRVGKSFFLQHFLQDHRGVYFLAADSTPLENLVELLGQVRAAFPERDDATLENYPTWRSALRLLVDLAADKPLAVVLDEFGYLAAADKTLPSILQAVWDTREAKRSHLKLILCGSELTSLSALDDYGKPLHGRFDWIETYRPLDYYDAGRFLDAASSRRTYSARDKLTTYGLYGGSGRYLVAIDPSRPLGANVAEQVLDPSGIFHREGETLLRQERDIRDVAGYNAVLGAIAGGESEWGKIAASAHIEEDSLHVYLNRLMRAGWVRHETPFKESKRRGVYRIADNMLKSWYRYVFRYRSALQMTPPDRAWRELVAPNISDYMGLLVFEEVAHQYLARFASRHGLPVILEMGRWWSRKNEVELDVAAELADGSYLYGECRWASSPVPRSELTRLQWKVEQLPHKVWKKQVRFILFSAGTFEPKLKQAAVEEDVILIDGDGLFHPPGS